MSSVVVVPMSVGGGRVAGAIAFVNAPGSRTFGDDDVALATEIGRRFGVAFEGARLSEERRRVADALQRELLPPQPSLDARLGAGDDVRAGRRGERGRR